MMPDLGMRAVNAAIEFSAQYRAAPYPGADCDINQPFCAFAGTPLVFCQCNSIRVIFDGGSNAKMV